MITARLLSGATGKGYGFFGRSMNTQSSQRGPAFKFATPQAAYKQARRRIINNALRRQQHSLDLSHYGLTELPPEIGRLNDLRVLNVSDNQLTSIPTEIGDMKSLVRLNLSSNKLAALPSEIGKLTELNNLNLSRNKLRSLPKTIGDLISLQYLRADGNSLRELPNEIGALHKLRILSLDENELNALPSDLTGLNSLRSISLMENKFSEFPSGILALTHLLQIDLDENELSTLPAEIKNLTLESVYLNGNKFFEFPAILIEMPTIKTIMFSRNQIGSVPSRIFQLTKLIRLSLASNLLREVPPEIGQLRGLVTLNLSGNKLTHLPKEIGQLRSLGRAAKEDQLPITDGLWIGDNPLPDPYPILIAPGQPKATENVLAWLRGELDPSTLAKLTPTSQAVTPPEPSEEAGPTFQIAGGQLDLVPGIESASNFDRATQNSLHQRLKRQVEHLREATAKVGNQHPQLSTVVEEYAKLVAPELSEIDVVDLWAVGNAMMAQAASFDNQDKTRTFTEPLEPHHLALLKEVSALHGGFILGFPKAAVLTDRADKARLGPEIIRLIEAPTSNVLSSLSRQRRFLSDRARELIEALDATLLAGSWDASRIGYTSYAVARNALVAIGRAVIWINDKGGTLAGGVIVAAAIAAANLPPDTLQMVLVFLKSNAGDILSFAAPFPELRNYMQWIIDHFDSLEVGSKEAKSNSDLLH